MRMKTVLSLLILLAGCSSPDVHQTKEAGGQEAKAQSKPRGQLLRKHFEARIARDGKTFTPEQRREIEKLYQRQTENPNERRENLKTLISKYPKANRAGCAIQYLGQTAEGPERESYFRKAIDEYGDCWYGDGVQVGAYARYYLAWHYQNLNRLEEAKALCEDLRKNFPEAINHRGDLLGDRLPQPRGGQ